MNYEEFQEWNRRAEELSDKMKEDNIYVHPRPLKATSILELHIESAAPADTVFLQNYRRLSRWRFLYSIAHAYAACKGSPAT
jgi:hypothetical protein